MTGRLSVGIAFSLLLLACAPAAGPAAPGAPAAPQPVVPEAGAKAPEPALAAVQRGGTFVQGLPGVLPSCYTLQVVERTANSALDHVYETLVRYDYLRAKDYRADLVVQPRLAERWEQPNPTTYVFSLRKGVKWHDGVPFTADDVIATYNATLKENFRSAGMWRGFKSIEKVDDNTIRITTGGPAPMALVNLGQPSDGEILPKKYLDAGTMEQNCVGTGPFKVVSWDKTKIEQVANPDFYLKDDTGGKLPYLDKVRIIFGMNRAAQEAALAAGEMDLYHFNSFEDYDAFKKKVPDLKTETFWTHHNYSILLNLNKKPFDDINVRKALNLLIDRQKVMELVTAGKGKIGLPIVPGIKEGWGIPQEELFKMPGWRQPKEQDIAEGKRLLAAAGLGSGFKFDHVYIKTWSGAPLGEALPGLLKQHGIELEMRGLDGATVEKVALEGSYDTILRLVANFDPILRTDEFFYSKAGAAKGAGRTDVGQDALIDQLRAELDVKKQKELVRKIQEIVVDNYWTAPLGDPAVYAVTRGWVNNYRPSFAIQPDVTATAEWLWLDQGQMPTKRKE